MNTTIIILILSVVLNILLLWYISYALRKLLFISESKGTFLLKIKAFAEHLEEVHSLETFYGDLTLQSLIRHSKDVLEEIKIYEEIYDLTTAVEEEEDAKEEEDQ